MLDKWDFQNEVENSTTQQINRQKSARNLEIIQFDPSEPRGVFFDTKRNSKNTATLCECDCKDFNFAGQNRRNSFKPCMHIYRLAIELGLLEAKYLDRDARHSLAGFLSKEETLKLQGLSEDPSQWGGWASAIHASGIQRNRQYRAYLIYYEEKGVTETTSSGWTVHEYEVALNRCECGDFLDRRLPCKHIYAAALGSKIELPFKFSDYDKAKKQGLDIVFEFPAAP
ncbi:MAG TPA: SWIM zinc finger family protein [Candidatus Sulfotelmatobacter sp.]|jgi:hypothetical protein|nr:SWIM zinc finger family protein [Candidatus Sulfotelmatobacter sp.]